MTDKERIADLEAKLTNAIDLLSSINGPGCPAGVKPCRVIRRRAEYDRWVNNQRTKREIEKCRECWRPHLGATPCP